MSYREKLIRKFGLWIEKIKLQYLVSWFFSTHHFVTQTRTQSITEYGYHHVVPDHLDGAAGDEEEGVQDVSVMDQDVSGGSVDSFEPHG